MVATNSIRAVATAVSVSEGAESLQTLSTLMCALEASLGASRKALLALDLAGIEQGTQEQVSLIHEFDAVLRRNRATPSTRSAERSPDFADASEQELLRSRKRLLDAIRLQAALLARARCKLRVLANMLAGPSVGYGPLLAQNADHGAPFDRCPTQRSVSCRA